MKTGDVKVGNEGKEDAIRRSEGFEGKTECEGARDHQFARASFVRGSVSCSYSISI